MTKGLSARARENCIRHWASQGYEAYEVTVTAIETTASWLVEAVGWKDERETLLSAVAEPEDAGWNITDLDSSDTDPFRGL